MKLLTQSRFPNLWRIFQYWVGGTVDKRTLCLLKYNGKGSVLEVGCSLGNISRAFIRFKNIKYTGIDIDPVMIQYARWSFASLENFTFVCEDFGKFSERTVCYDYVLFAGICHHVDDNLCRRMFENARRIVHPQGKIAVVDPLLPRGEDSWFVQQFIRIEQGSYLRTGDALVSFLKELPNVRLCEAEEHWVSCSPFHCPTCARFGVYTLKPI